MAQVAQKQHVVQSTETDTLDQVQSKVFIKKMLAISISNIVYLRDLFPECAFSDRKIEDLRLKILTERTHEGAKLVVQWMKGVYDALDKEYLRALIFAVIKDNEDTNSVVESYTFGFTYHNGDVETRMTIGSSSSASTKIPTQTETKESARKLLRNLVILTSEMKPLPKDVFLTVRLLYYDETTPARYQPPGFMEAKEHETLGMCVDSIRIKAGHVVTPFACMKVRVRAEKHQFETQNVENMDKDANDIPMDCQSQTASSIGDMVKPTAEMNFNSVCNSYDQEKLEKEKEEFFQQNSQEMQEELGVRCPCLDADNDGVMILCSSCNHWQHAICFCFPDDVTPPEVHHCHLCSDQKSKICTDPRLTGLSEKQQQEMCSWRRTLQACLDLETITVAMVCSKLSCQRPTAQNLISRLIEEGIVSVSKGHRQAKVIDHNELNKIFYRDIRHVQKNLARQRGEHVKDTPVLTQFAPLQPNKSSNMEVTSHTERQASKNKRSRDEENPPSPIASQASLDAFQHPATEMNRRTSKRRKMSKGPIINRY